MVLNIIKQCAPLCLSKEMERLTNFVHSHRRVEQDSIPNLYEPQALIITETIVN